MTDITTEARGTLARVENVLERLIEKCWPEGVQAEHEAAVALRDLRNLRGLLGPARPPGSRMTAPSKTPMEVLLKQAEESRNKEPKGLIR
jgi:hypothetical protein